MSPPTKNTEFSSGAAARERPRILVVEDDAEFRALVVAALRGDGADVSEAVTGADVLAELSDTIVDGAAPPFDLIVADIRIPLVSGLEILEGLREMGCTIPFLLMTAFADHSVRAAADRLHALRVFDKPFALDDLRNAVRKQLRRSRDEAMRTRAEEPECPQ